jgi:hypothetical protein
MPKRLIFAAGAVVGFLFGEVLRRRSMERLAMFEQQQAIRDANHAEHEKRWQEHISSLSPEEKIDWALFEAQMEADNWEGNWIVDDEEESEE